MVRFRLSEKVFLFFILLSALPSFITMVLGFWVYKKFVITAAEAGIFQHSFSFFYAVLLIIWFAAVAGAIFAIIYFIKRVLRPIENLSVIAGKIASGDLSQRIPYMAEDGEISHLYNSLRSMNDSLLEDIKKLKQINKIKSEFLSIASHQLRTPLSSIKWLIELLMETNKLEEDQKEKLRDIYKSNERLIELVDDLLSATKLETGSFSINHQPINLVELLKGCIASLRPVADSHNQKLNFIVEGEIKPIEADPMLLSQAFINILDNAFAYSPYGAEVVINLKRDDGHYIIAIHNFGSPIPESDHDKLFTKFYRGATAARLRPSGSGLGLFISKMAVESNGGSIWFESPTPDGEGTTFYISFPVE